MDIAAVHRLANKKTTIVRVVNRKFSREALFNGKKRGMAKIPGFSLTSFCQEFRYLNYVVRKADRVNVYLGIKHETELHMYKWPRIVSSWKLATSLT